MKPGGGMDGGQFDGYGQMNVQQDMQQDGNNMPMSMQMQLQQQQQQRVVGMNNPNQQQQQQVNQQQQQQQLLNAQRMMRPVMPNTNPGLRLLLQQQVHQCKVHNNSQRYNRYIVFTFLQQQTPNAQYRPVGMGGGGGGMPGNPGNIGNPHMGGGVRPINPNAPYDGNFDF